MTILPNLRPPVYSRLAVWIFLSFLVLYIAVTRGHFWGTEEIAIYHQARSLWERGDLAVAPIRDTVLGRGGEYYAHCCVGQSVLALPFYGAGKGVRRLLEEGGSQDWVRTIAGPVIGDIPDRRWGGEVEIFFVNLFNTFVVAALCAVFFAFSMRLGAAPRWALAATILLGATSYVAGFSTSFLPHPAEALFLLWAFYFLFCDAQAPSRRLRLWAGVAAGVAAFVRVTAAVAFPTLGLYLLWTVWRRRKPGCAPGLFLREALLQCLPFAAAVAGGLLLTAAVNYLKFESFDPAGGFSHLQRFDAPLWLSLYGYLFSPGGSIFLFTPLLLLAPWCLRKFADQRRPETLAILGITVCYLVLCGKSIYWHSQWSFGVRYFVPLVPFLLLPLARWLPEQGPLMKLAVALLAFLGLWVQILHFAVNVSYVYWFEKYPDFRPPLGYLFIPDASQIPAHWRALLAWDYRVDLWLVNVYRQFGAGRTVAVALPFVCLLVISISRLRRCLREAETAFAAGLAPTFAWSLGGTAERAYGPVAAGADSPPPDPAVKV